MYNYICLKYTIGVTFVNDMTYVTSIGIICYHV